MLIPYFNSNIPSNLSWFTYYLIFYFLFLSLFFFFLFYINISSTPSQQGFVT